MPRSTPTPTLPRTLADGLVLREAQADDLEAVTALEVAAFGESDGPAIAAHFPRLGGPGTWTVVCDGDRVVSASARIPQRLRLDGLELRAAQIEYVATDPAYQRRGLVRAQFDHHHRRSAQAGDLAQLVGGIPYLYRKLGYGYGLDHPTLFTFDGSSVPTAASVRVRPAEAEDVDTLVDLDRARPSAGLRSVRDEPRWELYLALARQSAYDHVFIAEREGRPVGAGRVHTQSNEHWAGLLPFTADDAEVTAALVHEAVALAQGMVLVAYDHPGHAVATQLREMGSPLVYDLGIYTRVPDPRAMLDHLRPLLTARLQASAFSGLSARLEISLYERGVALEIRDGEVTAVEACAPVEDPTEGQVVGVAPDWFGALVFGRWGAGKLAARADDVLLGGHREVMEALFPARDSDVVGEL